MELGIYFRSFFTNPARPLHEQIDDAVEICHVARDCGFAAITMPQHWVSHPTIWPQPFPMLARLAPEVGEMRLQTGIVLLPLHNPLQVAEDVATLDHIAKGRFVLGVGLGYRDTELEAVASSRKQRASRMTESIEVMKKLWTGEEIDHEGKYWTVHGAKMGFTPIQKPHPPIWIACQSEGAVRRSARIADAAYLAPQVGFDDVAHLISIYRDERSNTGQDAGHITISRGVAYAPDRETAIAQARESAASSYKMYSSWNMQEDTMVKINIASDSEVSAWAVTGNGDDCLQDLGRLAEDGVEYVGMTLLNMPKDLSGRKEYLQALAENVLHRMKQAG